MTSIIHSLRPLLAALVLILGPQAAAQQAEAPAAADRTAAYRLGTGDRVKVVVFGESDLSGTFEVGSTATLSMPLIGEVPAGGLTVRELEHRIAAMLRDGFLKEPQVGAEVVNYRPFYIIGEVHRPGSYAYVNNMTVLTAVALGGGFTHRARESKAWLTRAGDPEKKEVLVENTAVVMPGDVIRIDERFF